MCQRGDERLDGYGYERVSELMHVSAVLIRWATKYVY